MEAKNISYCSIVLNDSSRNKLLERFKTVLPEGWDVIAHHMTIGFGKGLPEELKGDLGETVNIKAHSIGFSDKAMAVGVSGYYSDNKIPHITLAINPDGGKAVMSNYITDWHDLSKAISLSGVVSEISQ